MQTEEMLKEDEETNKPNRRPAAQASAMSLAGWKGRK
jgi:hypothetical protein